jgi:competence protein ComFB
MKIQNYMEEVVQDELELLLSERTDVCKCQKCKFDMMVFALNRLPPKYVITDRAAMCAAIRSPVVYNVRVPSRRSVGEVC